MNKISSDEFIKKCNKIHNNKFIYNKNNYHGLDNIFKFTCQKHGELQMIAKKHYTNGCKYCKKEEKFIIKSLTIHNSIYNYDDIFLTNNKSKVSINCNKHGMFKQTPYAHLSGQGCPMCKVLDIDVLKKKIYIKHGNRYDISNIEYKNAKTKFKVICETHGEFDMSPINLNGCKKCANEKLSLSEKEFIQKSILIHGDAYEYSSVKYVNNKIPVEIICSLHGKFRQRPDDHISGHGCKYCKISSGERIISSILDELNIKYIREYKFENCKNIKVLSFDFYLPDFNTCIEYNGKQHYMPINFFGGKESYEKTILRDSIKKDYCKKNNIKLISIPYYENNIHKNIMNIIF